MPSQYLKPCSSCISASSPPPHLYSPHQPLVLSSFMHVNHCSKPLPLSLQRSPSFSHVGARGPCEIRMAPWGILRDLYRKFEALNLYRRDRLPTPVFLGFCCGSAGKNQSAMQERDLGSSPALGRIPWRRERLPTPVFWPGEFHGLYSPWGRRVGHD